MDGVRIGPGNDRRGPRRVVLHADQELAVRMLIGDEPATPWLVEYLNSGRSMATVLASAVWIMRGRIMEHNRSVEFALTSEE